MVHYNPLHPSESPQPGPFSACNTTRTDIYNFVHDICNTELTPVLLSPLCTRSTQLLEDLKTALNTVKDEFPVESRYMWVQSEIEHYEEVLAKMVSMDVKLRVIEKDYPLGMLSKGHGFEL
jgi:hypothetical protein